MFLPIKQMLQIDRVVEITDEGLVCEMDISGHWVFAVHFPSDPIFPGTLLIEAAGQAVAIWAWNAGYRGRPRLGKISAKFLAPVLPEHRIVTLVAKVHHRNSVFNGIVECFVSGQKMAEIEPVLIVISEPADVHPPLVATNGH
jgi:3-hydroxymyristoyl/3-hydroxydecanoyl-(acyl carrier protein) dehydratase